VVAEWVETEWDNVRPGDIVAWKAVPGPPKDGGHAMVIRVFNHGVENRMTVMNLNGGHHRWNPLRTYDVWVLR
jgi:hypothetical protein